MIRLLLFVGLGGFIGSACRFLLQQWLDRSTSTSFPLGIFVVNLLGCFLIGLFLGMALHKNLLSDEMRLFLATGFCGGFTTFSAFSFDNLELIQSGNLSMALMNILGSVVLGILGVYLGLFFAKLI